MIFKQKKYRLIELFLLFILFPVSLILDWSIIAKILLGVFGVIYTIIIFCITERVKINFPSRASWARFLKLVWFRFLIIAVLLTAYVYYTNSSKLFYVVVEKPKTWLFFLSVYTIMSVIPQEFLYRTFFFKRYATLFNNTNLFIIVNAVLFALAHLFFANSLVIIITFIGGIIFAITYNKTNSIIFVVVEHAFYGCWLYTVGMGEMLGFPT